MSANRHTWDYEPPTGLLEWLFRCWFLRLLCGEAATCTRCRAIWEADRHDPWDEPPAYGCTSLPAPAVSAPTGRLPIPSERMS